MDLNERDRVLLPRDSGQELGFDEAEEFVLEFGIEDPGTQGMADEDFALSELEHCIVVQKWMKENEPERFEEQFPPGSPQRII